MLKDNFKIDFSSPKLRYRSSHATLRNELLARAIGIKPNREPHIIDATAGFGRDSFILATLGYSITMLEREEIIFLRLEEAIRNAKQHSSKEVREAMMRMHLIHADALTWLPKHSADIIYLDPMFPLRQKSAAVKKENLILQTLVPPDDSLGDLLAKALACATKRVVIKRPRLAENIANQKPSFTLSGNSCRFDIYLV